jgi:hypothetical protein
MANATRRMGVREMLEFTSELFSTNRDWLETTFRSPAIHGLLAQWAESKSGSPCIRALPPGADRDCVEFSVIVSGESCSRLEILSLAQSDVSRYVAAMSEQPGQLALKHQCGHERSWNRLEGLSTENE